jgi:hypothetical protein
VKGVLFMKKTIIGIVLLLSSTFIYLGLTITAAFLAANITSWDPDFGKYGTAVGEYGLVFPFIIAYIMLAASIVILAREYFDKQKKQNISEKEN